MIILMSTCSAKLHKWHWNQRQLIQIFFPFVAIIVLPRSLLSTIWDTFHLNISSTRPLSHHSLMVVCWYTLKRKKINPINPPLQSRAGRAMLADARPGGWCTLQSMSMCPRRQPIDVVAALWRILDWRSCGRPWAPPLTNVRPFRERHCVNHVPRHVWQLSVERGIPNVQMDLELTSVTVLHCTRVLPLSTYLETNIHVRFLKLW